MTFTEFETAIMATLDSYVNFRDAKAILSKDREIIDEYLDRITFTVHSMRRFITADYEDMSYSYDIANDIFCNFIDKLKKGETE